MDALQTNTSRRIPFSWLLTDSFEERMEILKIRYKVTLILYPILLLLFFVGFVMATITVTRKKIRRYSSAIYLYAMLLFDLVTELSWFAPRTLTELQWVTGWSDGFCAVLTTGRYVGRVGSAFIMIILGLERILVLGHPKRFHALATAPMALLISGICLAVVVALSGGSMDKIVWNPRVRVCAHKYEVEKGWRQNLLTTYMPIFLFVSISVQGFINIKLGYLLLKRKIARTIDPIQSSISTARQNTDQLNRINLIVFLMSLNSFLCNIPQNVLQILYWNEYFAGMKLVNVIAIVGSLYILNMLILGLKVFVIGLASPKIRRQFCLALKCMRQGSAVRDRGIEINPVKLRQKEMAAITLEQTAEKNNLRFHTKLLKNGDTINEHEDTKDSNVDVKTGHSWNTANGNTITIIGEKINRNSAANYENVLPEDFANNDILGTVSDSEVENRDRTTVNVEKAGTL